MEKVIRDGKVAVLYSPDFGAGWSTWNSEFREQLLFHPRLIEIVEQKRHKEIDEDLMDELFGAGNNIYLGGSMDLEIEWLPEGTRFVVTEYDGAESIETADCLINIA